MKKSLKYSLIIVSLLPFLPSFGLGAEVNKSCAQSLAVLLNALDTTKATKARRIDLSRDEIALQVKTGKPDPGGDDFYFSGDAVHGGPTFPVAEVLGPELADTPIIIYRETGHGAFYYKGYRFDGVPYLTGPKLGSPFITQNRGLSDQGFAIALNGVPQDVLTRMEAQFKKMAEQENSKNSLSGLYRKAAGLFTSASCIKGVCNFLDAAGINMLAEMSLKEKIFPPEFVTFLANANLKAKSGEKISVKFYRLNDMTGPEIYAKAEASTAGFVKTAKVAGAGLAAVVTTASGSAVWFLSDSEKQSDKTVDEVAPGKTKEPSAPLPTSTLPADHVPKN